MRFILLSILFLNVLTLSAQPSVRLAEAQKQATALEEGTLVVLLRTNDRRLKQLGIVSRSSEISERERQRVKLKIAEIETEMKNVNAGLIKAFQTEYKFSKVCFAYDSSLVQLQKGNKTGFLVDTLGNIDRTQTLNTTAVFLAKYALVSTSKDTEGIVITDLQGKMPELPFPSIAVTKASGVMGLLGLLIDKNRYEQENIARCVRRLEKELQRLGNNE
jgi:hypothetical protein